MWTQVGGGPLQKPESQACLYLILAVLLGTSAVLPGLQFALYEIKLKQAGVFKRPLLMGKLVSFIQAQAHSMRTELLF